jgi:Protein of unknown function (DUF2924)
MPRVPPYPSTSAPPRSGLQMVRAPVWRPASKVQMKTASVEPGRAASYPSKARENICPPTQLELSQKIAALTDLTAQQLRDEWRRLYRSQPPRLSRDLLVRSLAYRMQELTSGGLSKATQRKLLTLARELESSGGIVSDPGPRIRPGTRLVREWRGRMHTVVVTDDGFEHAGKTFPL